MLLGMHPSESAANNLLVGCQQGRCASTTVLLYKRVSSKIIVMHAPNR